VRQRAKTAQNGAAVLSDVARRIGGHHGQGPRLHGLSFRGPASHRGTGRVPASFYGDIAIADEGNLACREDG
jgi:hypothetical protein